MKILEIILDRLLEHPPLLAFFGIFAVVGGIPFKYFPFLEFRSDFFLTEYFLGVFLLAVVAAAAVALGFLGRVEKTSKEYRREIKQLAKRALALGLAAMAVAPAILYDDTIKIFVVRFTPLGQEPGTPLAIDMTQAVNDEVERPPEMSGVEGLSYQFLIPDNEAEFRKFLKDRNVTHVIKGSIRENGNETKIRAELFTARESFSVWSENYIWDGGSKYELAGKIADSVAQITRPEPPFWKGGLDWILDRLPISRVAPSRAKIPISQPVRFKNVELEDLYLSARRRYSRRVELDKAAEDLRSLLQHQKGAAKAHALLARVYNLTPNYVKGIPRDQFKHYYELAQEQAAIAIELQPSLAQAHLALANSFRRRFLWQDAEIHYQMALKHRPKSGEIREDYAQFLFTVWRFEEAVTMAKEAVRLDPLVPVNHFTYASALAMDGDFDGALAAADEGLRINPRFRPAMRMKFRIFALKDGYRKVRKFPKTIAKTFPQEAKSLRVAVDWMLQGSKASSYENSETRKALKIIPELVIRTKDKDLFFEVLNEVKERPQEPTFRFFPGDKIKFDQFMDDRRFRDYLSDMGLPDYWRQVGWPDACRETSGTDFTCAG